MKVGTITKKQILLMERKARRDSDIEQGFKPMGHSIHKTKKQYNRKENKQINND